MVLMDDPDKGYRIEFDDDGTDRYSGPKGIAKGVVIARSAVCIAGLFVLVGLAAFIPLGMWYYGGWPLAYTLLSLVPLAAFLGFGVALVVLTAMDDITDSEADSGTDGAVGGAGDDSGFDYADFIGDSGNADAS